MSRTLLVVLACVSLVGVAGASVRTGSELYGLVGDRRQGVELVRLDERTLKPVGVRLGVDGFDGAWSFSPDRATLALGSTYRATLGRPAAVRFVLPAARRTLTTVTLKGELGHVAATAWAGGRVLALVGAYGPGPLAVYALDPDARRVVGRQALTGTVLGGARLHDALVLLLGPRRGVGTTRLVMVDGRLRVRAVALERVSGGFAPGIQRVPGLALDARRGRAFVVGAEEPIAAVDIDRLTVVYRAPDRLTQARAKTLAGTVRVAHWLGSGRLAVSGWKYDGVDERGLQIRTPAGLMVVDTDDWSARQLDEEAGSVAISGQTLVVAPPDGGVRAYEPLGTMLFEAFSGKPVDDVRTAGGRLFVRLAGERSARIIDGRSGRQLGTRRGALPMLLRGRAAPIR